MYEHAHYVGGDTCQDIQLILLTQQQQNTIRNKQDTPESGLNNPVYGLTPNMWCIDIYTHILTTKHKAFISAKDKLRFSVEPKGDGTSFGVRI